jgi:hypothetical protein
MDLAIGHLSTLRRHPPVLDKKNLLTIVLTHALLGASASRLSFFGFFVDFSVVFGSDDGLKSNQQSFSDAEAYLLTIVFFAWTSGTNLFLGQ